MTGVLLQVRLGSTRLPGKALTPLAGRVLIEHCMRSLARLPVSRHVVVTCEDSRAALEPVAFRCGFDVFVGPQDDVLERFVLAAHHYGIDEVVRATGDNPLVSWELARMAVALRRREGADYVGYDGPPLGTGVEVVTTAALERAHEESVDPYDHEHVTPYLYRNPDRFRCIRVQAPPAYCVAGFPVTVDTQAELARVASILDAISDGSPTSIHRLVSYARASGREGGR